MKKYFFSLLITFFALAASAVVDLAKTDMLFIGEYPYSASDKVGEPVRSFAIKFDGTAVVKKSDGSTKIISKISTQDLSEIDKNLFAASRGYIEYDLSEIKCLAMPNKTIHVYGTILQPNDTLKRFPLLLESSPCGKSNRHSTQNGQELAEQAKLLLEIFAR